jgi:hypothetical protein
MKKSISYHAIQTTDWLPIFFQFCSTYGISIKLQAAFYFDMIE